MVRILAVLTVVAGLAGLAWAAPLDEGAKGKFMGALVEADLALASGNASGAMQNCRTAEDIAKANPGDPMWAGEIEACFGRVAEVQGDKISACARYAKAEAALAEAVKADPQGGAADRRAAVERDRQRLAC